MGTELEFRLDSILERLSSLERKVSDLEEKINTLIGWRSLQEEKWQERDKMNGQVNSSMLSICEKLDDLWESVIRLQETQRQTELTHTRTTKRLNIMLAAFAGLMMLGTLIVQIVAVAR